MKHSTQENQPAMTLSLWIIIILGLLTAIGPLATDMYLPAFPQISKDLAGYGNGAAQITLTVWFIGLAIGQFTSGPIADRYGRRTPLFLGMFLFTLGSAGCAVFSDFYLFCFCRLVSSLGGSVAMVVPRAMVRDVSSGTRGIKIMAQLALVGCIVPIVAPTLGGLIVARYPWRVLFWIMTLYGIIGTLAVAIMLPDTLPIKYRIRASVRSILWRYVQIIQEPIFLSNTMITSCGLFMIFAYLSGTPDILGNIFHFSKLDLALWFGINSAVIAGCNQINGLLVSRIRPTTLTNTASGVAFITTILFIILCLINLPHNFIGIFLICAPIVIIMGCLGFILPNCTIFAFTLHGRRVGSASALLGTIQFILGALSSWMMGLLPQNNMLYVAIGVSVGVFGIFIANLWRRQATNRMIQKMNIRIAKGQQQYNRLVKDLE